MYTRILVPLDGSKLAERALPTAESLARLLTIPLHFVRVVDPSQLESGGLSVLAEVFAAGASSPFLSDEDVVAHAYLERMTAREIAQGLAASGEVRRGVAAREIIALTQPGDLIVMSTHGRGGVARWFLGSVAEAVMRQAMVPALLVPTREHRAVTAEGQDQSASLQSRS